MISRFKVILICMIAVLAAGALACGSASALSNSYFEQPSKALGNEKMATSVGVAQLQSEISGVKILIECAENSAEGEIEAAGKSKGSIKIKKCSLSSISEGKKTNLAASCPIKEPLEFKVLGQLITQTKAGVVAAEIKPAEGKIFVEQAIGGAACVITGGAESKFKAEGTYVASLGDQAEEDATEHEAVTTEAGSSLTFGGKPAAVTTTLSKIKRTNGKEWYVD